MAAGLPYQGEPRPCLRSGVVGAGLCPDTTVPPCIAANLRSPKLPIPVHLYNGPHHRPAQINHPPPPPPRIYALWWFQASQGYAVVTVPWRRRDPDPANIDAFIVDARSVRLPLSCRSGRHAASFSLAVLATSPPGSTHCTASCALRRALPARSPPPLWRADWCVSADTMAKTCNRFVMPPGRTSRWVGPPRLRLPSTR